MKKQMKYFLLAFIIILLSTPLGYRTIKIVYYNKNLSGEFVSILNGFIHSYMLIGILVFCLGVIDIFANKNNK